MSVMRGRANDPLLHSTCWTMDQHSAVLVVSLAAISVLRSHSWLQPLQAIDSGGYLFGCRDRRGETSPATFYLSALRRTAVLTASLQ